MTEKASKKPRNKKAETKREWDGKSRARIRLGVQTQKVDLVWGGGLSEKAE